MKLQHYIYALLLLTVFSCERLPPSGTEPDLTNTGGVSDVLLVSSNAIHGDSNAILMLSSQMTMSSSHSTVSSDLNPIATPVSSAPMADSNVQQSSVQQSSEVALSHAYPGVSSEISSLSSSHSVRWSVSSTVLSSSRTLTYSSSRTPVTELSSERSSSSFVSSSVSSSSSILESSSLELSSMVHVSSSSERSNQYVISAKKDFIWHASKQYQSVYYHPIQPGEYPLFIWMPNTNAPINDTYVLQILRAMSKKGFVAVALDYGQVDDFDQDITKLYAKASSVFSKTDSHSAIAVIDDSIPSVDVSRGIVVAGWGQGASVSVVARDYNPQVRAVLAFGAGIGQYNWLEPALGMANTMIDKSRLRSIIGAQDQFNGALPTHVRMHQEVLTGYGDATHNKYNFIQPDGSGWYMVYASLLTTGSPDHAFFRNQDTLEENFKTGMASWCLHPSLNWLTLFVD
ncbi:MAG: hypothetical protein OCC49_15060 [Fibrobacterales bacterium]